MEKENKVMLNVSFDPARIEDVIDGLLPTRGKKYKPNQFEIDVIKELR